jgi:hypothetical protein
MKKFFPLAISVIFIIACNNSSNTSSAPSSDSGTTNVENVNGNIPDSSSGIQLNKPLPVDSSRVKDSTRH